MYLDFYRLKSPPFESTPDPAFLFVSASHQAALDALAVGTATRQGFVTITAPPGVGKTTLVRAYLARVAPPQRITMVLWQARLSFRELLTLLVRRFAQPVGTDDAGALLAQLRQLLWHEAQQGRQVALLIDEAQDLPLETLAQLPLLADLSPSRASPLQIVLVGQPALLRHLRRRALRHVAQHISIRATLRPLTEAESLLYIRQRVVKVALPGGPLFTQDALHAIVRHTPRRAARPEPRVHGRLAGGILGATTADYGGPRPAGHGRAHGLDAFTTGVAGPRGRGRPRARGWPPMGRAFPSWGAAHPAQRSGAGVSAERGAEAHERPRAGGAAPAAARGGGAGSVPSQHGGQTRSRRGPRPPRVTGGAGAPAPGDAARHSHPTGARRPTAGRHPAPTSLPEGEDPQSVQRAAGGDSGEARRAKRHRV
jgi:type II secretory pathway predicted ATPase ExeA